MSPPPAGSQPVRRTNTFPSNLQRYQTQAEPMHNSFTTDSRIHDVSIILFIQNTIRRSPLGCFNASNMS
jgi:hypothetical protein